MKRKVLIVLAVLALIGLYARGTFDHPLYNVGLNFHECARNGFGAVFCGQELDEYREHIAGAKRKGEEAAHQINEEAAKRESEYEATAKRQQEELAVREAQIQREGEEAQRRIREGG